jgi:hypothetical protein
MSLNLFVLFFALTFLLPHVAQAQATVPELETRLIAKPLYLRGFWMEGSLHFDSNGQLVGKSRLYPFTLCGANIKKVRLEADKLVLEGKRAGLEFADSVPKRVDLEGLRIIIDRPQNGDFGRALASIFADGLDSFTSLLPAYWQVYAKVNFLPLGTSGHLASDVAFVDPTMKKIGGSVEPPKVLKSIEPQYTRAARDLQYSSKTVVGLIVEENGIPSRVSVVRAAGLGLDEQTLSAVSHYVFAPAVENGKPVRVQLNVEVPFDIIK